MTLKSAFFNCVSGASGDMIVGALLSLGADLEAMREAVDSLGLGPVSISSESVRKGHLMATAFRVEVAEGAVSLESLEKVQRALDGAGFPEEETRKSMMVFQKLAEAEGKAHGETPREVRFHELGSPDTLVDVVCAVLGFSQLGIREILVSPVNVGSGTVETAHGRFPVPAPATVNLLQGFDICSDGEPGEKTTPTGAAILTALGRRFDGVPVMTVDGCGFGAGQSEFQRSLNVLQMIVGRRPGVLVEDRSVLLECNIDDMNPQVYPYLTERLLEAGALDVFISPVLMKKGRPGYRVGVISPPEGVRTLGEILMAESTTIGMRMWPVDRLKAAREIAVMDTEWGDVAVKISTVGGGPRAVPEFEDCRRVAEESGKPLPEVMSLLGRMASERFEKGE